MFKKLKLNSRDNPKFGIAIKGCVVKPKAIFHPELVNLLVVRPERASFTFTSFSISCAVLWKIWETQPTHIQTPPQPPLCWDNGRIWEMRLHSSRFHAPSVTAVKCWPRQCCVSTQDTGLNSTGPGKIWNTLLCTRLLCPPSSCLLSPVVSLSCLFCLYTIFK